MNEERARAAPSTSASALTACLLVSTAWLLVVRVFSGGPIYQALGPFAALVVVWLAAPSPRRAARWLRPSGRALLAGLVAGALMTAVTYPGFALAVRAWPGLAVEVEQLYATARVDPRWACFWLGAIIPAEELLWRGALLETLEQRHSPRAALVLSTSVYAIAQAGTGSWLVVTLALLCGGLWAALRQATGSLAAPIAAHAIWTPTVLHLFPVIAPR